MAVLNIVGNASDGKLEKMSWKGSWAACQAATPSVASATSATASVFHAYTADPSWTIDRAYYRFDVSPFQAGGAYAGATISGIVLNIAINSTNGYTTPCTWYWNGRTGTDWATALAAADWGAGSTAASDSWTPVGWDVNHITLTNISNLLTSNGRLELRVDSEGTEPAAYESFVINLKESTGSEPSIDVTYTMPTGAPKQYMHLNRLRH